MLVASLSTRHTRDFCRNYAGPPGCKHNCLQTRSSRIDVAKE